MTVVEGDIIRTSARFKATTHGDVVNVFHWRAGAGYSDSDADVMTDIEAALSTAFALMATYLWADLDPYDIRHDIVAWVGGKETVVRNLGTRSWVLTTPPSSSAEELPPMVSPILNFRTALPRTFGRKYLPPIMETSQNGGVMIGAILSALTSFGASLMGQITGTSGALYPGVVTYKVTGLVANWAPFIGVVINSILGTQRRRRQNRGS